jgi:hypothetical protein
LMSMIGPKTRKLTAVVALASALIGLIVNYVA